MSDLKIANLATNSSGLTEAKGDLAVKGLRNVSTKDNASKIDKAAHDFESIMIGQWLEKAEKSFATVPGTDPDRDKDSSHDQFQSIACESLAGRLGKTGGFGIAAMISKHLAASAARYAGSSASEPVSGSAGGAVDAPKIKTNK
jgi:Rod binding domain-containing protein